MKARTVAMRRKKLIRWNISAPNLFSALGRNTMVLRTMMPNEMM